MARNNEKGQAIIFVVLAVGIFMFGAIALAIDGAQLYAHQQMAQVAADAAAQGGIMSIFDGTNTGANAFGSAAYDCSTTDATTPCIYARRNGFGSQSTDTVSVSFPGTAPAGVPADATTCGALSTKDAVNMIQVTVQRPVKLGLARMVGAGDSTTVKATAIAAILQCRAAIPIIVTHPTLSGSFSTNGGTGGASDTLKICGGPQRSIQVNSTSATALSFAGGGHINLTHAGPLVGPADSDGCTGTGGDFGVFGGPSPPAPTNIDPGSTGHYLQPASPIRDPFADVPVPNPASLPSGLAATPVAVSKTDTTRYGCPSGDNCTYYQPGVYPSGLTVANETGFFCPGVYYMSQGGFNMASNSSASMVTADPSPCNSVNWDAPYHDRDTGGGMMVYNTGPGSNDTFNFTSNAGSKGPITLLGSLPDGKYQGILFFQDRASVTHSGVGADKAHSIQGGGTISLTGSIYINNSPGTVSSTRYQTVNVQGNAGSTTTITGEIVTNVLSVGGTAGIKMTLDPTKNKITRYVALIK